MSVSPTLTAIKRNGKTLINTHRCNACGKRLRSRTMLCYRCRRLIKNVVCDWCFFQLCCSSRINHGLWVLCEFPDHNDLARAQSFGVVEAEYKPQLAQTQTVLQEALAR